jgi:hypothetical protein
LIVNIGIKFRKSSQSRKILLPVFIYMQLSVSNVAVLQRQSDGRIYFNKHSAGMRIVNEAVVLLPILAISERIKL